jgi:hypothetical protein
MYMDISKLDCPSCGSGLEELTLKKKHIDSVVNQSRGKINKIPYNAKRVSCIGCGNEFILIGSTFIEIEEIVK